MARRSRQPGAARDRDSVRARRRGTRPLRTTTSRVPVGARRGQRPLGAESRSPPAVRRRRTRTFWLSRPPLSAGHRRNRRATDAGLRTSGEGRRVLPRLRRRERGAAAAAPAGAPLAQWQLSRLLAHGGARRRVPRIPAAAIGDAGPGGTAGSEADGTVAQRCAADALP